VRVCASTVDDVETEAFGQAETQSETGKQHHRTFRDREPLRILYHIYLLPPLTPISSGAFNFDLYSIFHPSKPIRSSALCSVIACLVQPTCWAVSPTHPADYNAGV